MNAIAYFENHGFVSFSSTAKKSCLITFRLHSFQPFSTHAIHIHEYGDLRQGCSSLGGHYNPHNQTHGNILSNERHVGDLINNFTLDKNGNFEFEYIDPSISINDIIGRSVVIHENLDDLGLKSLYNIPYISLDDCTLRLLCKQRGYTNLKTRKERIDKLERESLITGNAGLRLACAIIGKCR